MATFQPLHNEGTNQNNMKPMAVVVQQPLVQSAEPIERGEDSCCYWLACLFCNCCGLGLIAFILHYVAKSLFEEGGSFRGAARKIWKRARCFRKAGVIIGCVITTLYILYLVFIFFMVSHSDQPDGPQGGPPDQ